MAAQRSSGCRRVRRIGMLALLGLLAGLGGVFYALTASLPRDMYAQMRTELRTGLNLEKRWVAVPAPDQAEGRSTRVCPDAARAIVLVTGGQSNAGNFITGPPYVTQGDVAVWFDGRCYPSVEPLLGATGLGGSLWTPLADQLAQETQRPVLLINGAIEGTQFSDWLDARSGYYAALLDRVAAARAAGFEADLVLWHQGETDAAVFHEDVAGVQRDFQRLLRQLRRDIPETAPIYAFQASRCRGPKRMHGFPQVIAAMRETAGALDGVLVGMNTDVLGPDFRWDMCHFNSFGRAALLAEVFPELRDILIAKISE